MQPEVNETEPASGHEDAVELRFRLTAGEAIRGRLRWAIALAPVWVVGGLLTGAFLELVEPGVAAIGAGATLCVVPFALALANARASDEHFVFDERGLLLISPAFEMRVPWSAVRHISKTGDLVLFWNGPRSFVFMPRRAFSDGQWSAVEALAARGAPRGPADPVPARSSQPPGPSPVRPRRTYRRWDGDTE